MENKKINDIDALAGERWFPKETTITDDMKSLWGDWGVCSEVDKLRDVIMRRPGRKLRILTGKPRGSRLRFHRQNSEHNMTTWRRFIAIMVSTCTMWKSNVRTNRTRCSAETFC